MKKNDIANFFDLDFDLVLGPIPPPSFPPPSYPLSAYCYSSLTNKHINHLMI